MAANMKRIMLVVLGTGALIAAAAVAGGPWLDELWRIVYQALAGQWRWLALALALLGAVLLAVAPRARGHETALAAESMPRWLTDRAIAAVTVTAAILAVASTILLLLVATSAPAEKNAELRIEAIKYGLGAIAGSGALAILLLAVRRQRLGEQTLRLQRSAQTHTEMDAAERRVTELYVNAADQLGSDKAPVRLAGMYALERLAQDNPIHRQTIADVFSAYLRMPYTPPSSATADTAADAVPAEATAATPSQPDRLETGRGDGDNATTGRDPREERQVRLAAQRILARHLHSTITGTEGKDEPDPQYWCDIDLDFTGAFLENFSLDHCQVRRGSFANAIFTGTASFVGTTFTDTASFRDATFQGNAAFPKSTFHSDATFAGASFNRWAEFTNVTFHRDAQFTSTNFQGRGAFEGAIFRGDAAFAQARFGSAAFQGAEFFAKGTFDGSIFGGGVFDGAIFHQDAEFARTEFRDTAAFIRATFWGGVAFARTTDKFHPTLGGRPVINGRYVIDVATFHRYVSFEHATFHGHVLFAGVVFHSNPLIVVTFGEARVEDIEFEQTWPPGWTVHSADGRTGVLVPIAEDQPGTQTTD